jgi:branched-chain amino acid aminotransferase
MSKTKLQFVHHPHPSPVPADKRAELLKNPGFGRVFSDHMVTIRYHEAKGWHDARIEPRAPIPMDPAAAVLHYAQEVFEGLKAYRTKDGGATMFRPIENARRFQKSAERLAMPSLPEELFLEACDLLVKTDREWIPDGDGGSLYIRPFMFANEIFLGVKPSSDYLFIVIASSVGSYFKTDAPAVSLWVSQEFTRAAPGGTGAAKCGGNYASSLLAQAEATRHGCDQVVFLDAQDGRYVEELGGMNMYFVQDDGRIVTPETGTILEGITRSSIIELAGKLGHEVEERKVSIDEWREGVASGRITEVFACGTAAVVTPVGTLKWEGGEVPGSTEAGPVTMAVRKALVDIQYGRAEDGFGWMHRIV